MALIRTSRFSVIQAQKIAREYWKSSGIAFGLCCYRTSGRRGSQSYQVELDGV